MPCPPNAIARRPQDSGQGKPPNDLGKAIDPWCCVGGYCIWRPNPIARRPQDSRQGSPRDDAAKAIDPWCSVGALCEAPAQPYCTTPKSLPPGQAAPIRRSPNVSSRAIRLGRRRGELGVSPFPALVRPEASPPRRPGFQTRPATPAIPAKAEIVSGKRCLVGARRAVPAPSVFPSRSPWHKHWS